MYTQGAGTEATGLVPTWAATGSTLCSLVGRYDICTKYTECFLSNRSNWVLPPPRPQVSVVIPFLVQGGRHTHLRGRGWVAQFRRSDRHSGTLCTLRITVFRQLVAGLAGYNGTKTMASGLACIVNHDNKSAYHVDK